MAQQQYPAQGAYPPPQAHGPAPPSAYAYVPPSQPQPAPAAQQAPPKKEKKGMFSSFMKEVDKVGKQISKEIDHATAKVNEAVDKNYSSALLDMFKTGNVVQLVSRITAHCVQIVMSPQGIMVLDAMGPCDPNAFNSLWTVTNEGSNQVRLHNHNNYLAVENGHVMVKPYATGSVLGPETKFQLSQVQFQFVTLEPLSEKGRYVAFLPTGQLKPAKDVLTKDNSAQYGVKLVSSAYPVVTYVNK